MKSENVLDRMLKVSNANSLAQLAKELGISSQGVYEARNKNKVPHNWIIKIADKYNLSVDYLYGKDTNIISDSNFTCDNDVTFINIKKARVSAGIGSLETSDESIGKRAFMTQWVTQKGDPKNMVLIEVSGDSMFPEILNKDLVLIDVSKKDIYPSQIYAVGFEDSIYIKRIELLPDHIILKSTNKEYEPVSIQMNEYSEEQFRIIGKVLWVCREY